MTLPNLDSKQKYAIRSMLCASPGHTLLAFDFAQAESWIVAYLSNCTEMKDALNRPKSHGLHNTTTRGLFGISQTDTPAKDQTYIGKKFNHSCSYRTSPMMISFMVNVESINPPYITLSVADSKRHHGKWKEIYWQIPNWWESIERELNQTRRLRTPYGRERSFYGQWGDSLFKEATAYVPQSTIADHCLGMTQSELNIKGGIREIYHKLVPKGIKILNTSHDSVIVECLNGDVNSVYNDCYNYLRRPLVVNGEQITIPVDGEIGQAWGELEPYTGG